LLQPEVELARVHPGEERELKDYLENVIGQGEYDMFVTKLKGVLAGVLVVGLALAGTTGLIYQTQAADQPKPEVPALKAGLGTCAVDFVVKDGDGKPVYQATIHSKIRYGALSVKRMDVEISTNDEGKARIEGLKIKHDGTYNSGGYVRQGVTPTDDPLTSPGAVHPLVCRHPDTGRRMLYLGRRRNAYLVGLGLAESEALLNELWAFVDRSEFAWEHVWRVGDLVLWDNRCTMHRRDAFDPNSRRIMHRTQVKGEQRPA
jgi:hypothetical protein